MVFFDTAIERNDQYLKSPFEILEVSPTASPAEIKKQYRKLAQRYHPDKYPNDNVQAKLAEEKMKEINVAYDAIVNRKFVNSYTDPRAEYNTKHYTPPTREEQEELWFTVYIGRIYAKVKDLIDKEKYKKALRFLAKDSNFADIPGAKADFDRRNTTIFHYYCAYVYYEMGDIYNAVGYSRKVMEKIADKSDKEYLDGLLVKDLKRFCKKIETRVRINLITINQINELLDRGEYSKCKEMLKSYKRTHKYVPAEYYTTWAYIFLHEKAYERAYRSLSKAMKINYYASGSKDMEFMDLLVLYQKRQKQKEKVWLIFRIFTSVIVGLLSVVLLPFILVMIVVDLLINFIKWIFRKRKRPFYCEDFKEYGISFLLPVGLALMYFSDIDEIVKHRRP